MTLKLSIDVKLSKEQFDAIKRLVEETLRDLEENKLPALVQAEIEKLRAEGCIRGRGEAL